MILDRDSAKKAGFYSREWEYLGINNNEEYLPLDHVEKPKSLEQMIYCAEILSKGIPFVRIDFYDIEGVPVFGEMTFSSASGFFVSTVDIDGHSMAEYIDLHKEYPLFC